MQVSSSIHRYVILYVPGPLWIPETILSEPTYSITFVSVDYVLPK